MNFDGWGKLLLMNFDGWGMELCELLLLLTLLEFQQFTLLLGLTKDIFSSGVYNFFHNYCHLK
jgi:hypothetical protein